MPSTEFTTVRSNGHDIQNWALFEPFKLSPKHSKPINLADPELQRALAIHHLEIGSR
jgi:hypothetical protein